jgi:hypothetical protein
MRIHTAPGHIADADDTAKTLVALVYLGSKASPEPLLEAFEVKEHFQTYKLERNPSVSVHCNILLALLYSAETRFFPQITKCVSFLCNSAWSAEGLIKDKWVNAELFKIFMKILLTSCE